MEDTATSTAAPLTPAKLEEVDQTAPGRAGKAYRRMSTGDFRARLMALGERHPTRKATKFAHHFRRSLYAPQVRGGALERVEQVRLRWSASRTELDPDDLEKLADHRGRLEHHLHQDQRVADRAAERPPPDVGTAHDLAVAALIAAPRPGPSAGMLAVA